MTYRLWTGIAKVIVVIAAAALVVVIISRDKIVWSLPAWLQDQLLPVGPQVVLEVEPANGDLPHVIEESVRIINRRLYDLGASASARQQGQARIVVRFSPSADTKRSIEVATRLGKLEFRLTDATMTAAQAVAGRPPRTSEVLYDSNKAPYLVEKQVLISGRDLVDAYARLDSSFGAVVVFQFNDRATEIFGRLTRANVDRAFAIVFDNEVLSAPVIREPICTGEARFRVLSRLTRRTSWRSCCALASYRDGSSSTGTHLIEPVDLRGISQKEGVPMTDHSG